MYFFVALSSVYFKISGICKRGKIGGNSAMHAGKFSNFQNGQGDFRCFSFNFKQFLPKFNRKNIETLTGTHSFILGRASADEINGFWAGKWWGSVIVSSTAYRLRDVDRKYILYLCEKFHVFL
jgi:hypothetical protein